MPLPLTQGRYYFRAQSRDLAGNWSVESATRSFIVNLATSPIDNQFFPISVATYRPTFVWATSTVPATAGTVYTLEIATNQAFSSILHSASLNANSYPLPLANALPHGKYFWRVKVNNASLPPEVFNTLTVSPLAPVAPVLVSPLNVSTFNTPIRVLDWNSVANAATYRVELAKNTAFTLDKISVAGLTATDFTTSALSDGLWYWRAYSVNSFGLASAASGVFYFTIDTTAPNVPTLISPVDGNTLAPARPAFSWSAVPTATQYELRLSTNSTFTNPMVYSVATPTFTPPADLSSRMHWWSVRARDAAVTNNWSAWSAPRTFVPRSLAGSVLSTCRTTQPSLVLRWEAVTWAISGYRVEVSKTPTFAPADLVSSPAIVSVGTTTFTTPNLPNGRVFWRVGAVNAAGTTAYFSSPSACTIDN